MARLGEDHSPALYASAKPMIPARGESQEEAPTVDSQSCFWAGPIAIEHNALSARRVDDKLTALKPAQHPAQSHFGERARNLVGVPNRTTG